MGIILERIGACQASCYVTLKQGTPHPTSASASIIIITIIIITVIKIIVIISHRHLVSIIILVKRDRGKSKVCCNAFHQSEILHQKLYFASNHL